MLGTVKQFQLFEGRRKSDTVTPRRGLWAGQAPQGRSLRCWSYSLEPSRPPPQPWFSDDTAVPQTCRLLHLRSSHPQRPPLTSASEPLSILQGISQVPSDPSWQALPPPSACPLPPVILVTLGVCLPSWVQVFEGRKHSDAFGPHRPQHRPGTDCRPRGSL